MCDQPHPPPWAQVELDSGLLLSAFPSPASALRCNLELVDSLMQAPWPQDLLVGGPYWGPGGMEPVDGIRQV